MADKVTVKAIKPVFVPDEGKYGTYYDPGDTFLLALERAEKLAKMGVVEIATAAPKQKAEKAGGEK